MFETSIDAWYAWLGVAAVSVAAFGTVAALPSETPPAAASVADAVDRVAASPYEAQTTAPIEATEYRLTPGQIALRNDRGRSRATFAYGPIAPATDGSLRAVLEGAPPTTQFASPAAFERAIERAHQEGMGWRPAPDAIRVRRVSWEGVDATLVG